jgi:peptidoglycan/LPS O-acetylase OafA/YrhL
MNRGPMPKRTAYIDGLRGLAALLVVFRHGPLVFVGLNNPANPILFVSRLGYSGVDLFFVLSGFCLAYPTIASGKPFSLTRFAAHRLVRVIPPFYAAIAILGTLYFLGVHSAVSAEHRGGIPISGWDVVRQALFIDRGTALLTPQFWTLPVEMRWYFLFPVVLWLWFKDQRLFFGVLGIAIVASLFFAPTNDVLALPAFLLGIVAARVVSHNEIPRLASWSALIGTLAAVIYLEWRLIEASYLIRQVLWELAYFWLVVTVSKSNLLQRAFSSRVMLGFGAISYSLYLMHMAPINWVQNNFLGIPPLERTILGMALGIAVSIPFWFLFERPFTVTHKAEANEAVRNLILRIARRPQSPASSI